MNGFWGGSPEAFFGGCPEALWGAPHLTLTLRCLGGIAQTLSLGVLVGMGGTLWGTPQWRGLWDLPLEAQFPWAQMTRTEDQRPGRPGADLTDHDLIITDHDSIIIDHDSIITDHDSINPIMI